MTSTTASLPRTRRRGAGACSACPRTTARGTGRPGRRIVETVKRAPLGVLGIPIPRESDASPAEMARWRQGLDDILFIGNYAGYRSRMRTFVLPSFGDGFLRINLEGRERDGLVAIADYDAERRAVDALIGVCRDPRTGAPVAGGIEWFDASTALDPARRPYADGVVAWTHPTDAFEHPIVGTIGPFPLHRTGVHHDVGFLWEAGPTTSPGALTNDPCWTCRRRSSARSTGPRRARRRSRVDAAASSAAR